MLKSSEFNSAVPKFTNGNYASTPLDPTNIEEPTLQDYVRGVEPLETLPAQWWNWLCNQFTSRFNKLNTYVKNIFDELTQLLSLVNVTPDGTESTITTGQLKNAFKELYPTYVSDKLELGTTYVKQTTTVNGHALSGNVTVSKSDVGLGNVPNVSTNDQTPTYTEASSLTALSSGEKLSIAFGKLAKAVSSLISHIGNTNNPHSVTKAQLGLGNVVNTGDSATPTENGTDKFTNGGAYTLKKDLIDIAESLPADAVLHYSFDNVPDYPDGTADVRLLNNNTYNIQSTGYKFNNNGGSTISNVNGKVEISIVGGSSTGVNINGTPIMNKIIKLKLNVTALIGTLVINNGISTTVARITKVGTYEICYLHNNTETTYTQLFIICNGQGNSCTFTVEEIYIGEGSYSTPIIDNANGQYNATNNGGIAVQGISGKGAYFPSATQRVDMNYIRHNSNNNLTISVWVKVSTNYNGENESTYKAIVTTGAFAGCFGFYRQGNNIGFIARDNIYSREFTVAMDKGKWHLYTAVYNGSTRNYKFYLDGNLKGTSGANVENYSFGSTNWVIWGNDYKGGGTPVNTDQSGTLDDILFFNRVLSDEEVMALYLNKANTPKYYGEVPVTRTINDYPLNKDIVITKSDVSLGNVVNTGDSDVPSQNGTTKFTTGGAYNLLTSLAPIFSTSTSYTVGDMVTYNGRLYTCTTAHSAGAWNASHFTVANLNNFYNFTNGEHNPKIWTSRLLRDGLCKNWVKALGVPSSSSSGDTIKCIHYANNIWVALGNTSLVTYTCVPLWSTDGITWNQGTGLTHYINNDLYFANNIWVAVGNDGMAWSTDGKTWTEVLKTNVGIYNVLFANGIWVAVQHSGSPWWSTDGKNWTQSSSTISSIPNNRGRSLWNAMGIWVIFSKDIYTSSDGKTWTQRTTDNKLIYGCYGNGEWLAINNSKIYKSTDGTTWNSITNSSSIAGHIVFGDGLYVCGKNVSSSVSSFVYSQDGIHWSDIVGATDLNYIDAEKTLYHNGLWVSVNSLGYVAISYDGVTWIKTYPQSVRSLVTESRSYYSVYAHDGKWVIGGSLLSMYCSSLDNAHL